MSNDDGDLFASAGIDLPPTPPTPEEIAGKLSNTIFRPWYKQFYEGRYVQDKSHVAKVLRDFVLKVVVNGQEELSTVKLAMHNLGARQVTITPLALQYALGQAKAELIRLRNTGVVDSAHNASFEEFMVHGLPASAYEDRAEELAPMENNANELLHSMEQYNQSPTRNESSAKENHNSYYDDLPF